MVKVSTWSPLKYLLTANPIEDFSYLRGLFWMKIKCEWNYQSLAYGGHAGSAVTLELVMLQIRIQEARSWPWCLGLPFLHTCLGGWLSAFFQGLKALELLLEEKPVKQFTWDKEVMWTDVHSAASLDDMLIISTVSYFTYCVLPVL